MHDWCISRQLWWGHRIPVWYSPDGEVRCVGPNERPPQGWTQDPDVLDTWFSSALWPFSTLGWPDDTPDLRAFYPTSVLVTGYDILFFWVVRMMMFGLYANREKAPDEAVPFRNVVLHGLVRDQFGKKMSKSRGNTVDPLDWIDRFGADAVRFTLARGSNPGSDTSVSEEWAAGARNFCNKLWNATRFALLNGATVDGASVDGQTGTNGPFDTDESSTRNQPPPGAGLAVADRWILSRLSAVIAEVDELLERFEFGKACDALYHFAWDEFCDWYLELAKVPLAAAQAEAGQGDAAAQAAADRTKNVLGFVLDQMLRLLHPVMPFVTDELWTTLTGQDSVMMAAWPTYAGEDKAAEAEVASLMRLVTEIRRFRSDQGLRPGQRVPARLVGIAATPLADHERSIRSLLRLTDPADAAPANPADAADPANAVNAANAAQAPDGFSVSASLAVEGVTVELDLAGTVDVAAERARMEKDLAVARKEAAQMAAKLGNPAFTGKAPADVVAKSRQRQADAEADIARLEARLASLR
jgi:valyl-tRNA synthetase